MIVILVVIAILIFSLVLFRPMIETVLNLIFRTGDPFLGFQMFVSIRERFGLARRVRTSSEELEREFAAEIALHKGAIRGVIIIFLAWVLAGWIMEECRLPGLLIFAVEMILALGILYCSIDRMQAKEYEDHALMKKCEKCEVVRLYTYIGFGGTHQIYASVRMSDAVEYHMIPVINLFGWEFHDACDYSGSVTDCLVYYRRWPFAICCVLKSLT